MNEIAMVYYKRCLEYGLNPVRVPEMAGFEVQFGKKRVSFRQGFVSLNSDTPTSIAANKFATNRLLARNGIPVPNAKAYTKKEYQEGEADFSDLNFPVVLKPTWDTACGKGVICKIPNAAELNALMAKSYGEYKCLSIEEFQGDLRSYRVLVLDGKVIAVLERNSAHVIGDGKHTIDELIEIENAKRVILKEKVPFGKIQITEETQLIFRELGISSTYIPALNEKIKLRHACNATFGGTVVGLNIKAICKENAAMAVRAAEILDLKLVGFDVICEDIGIPLDESRGYFIEANYDPDITIHEFAPEGEPSYPSKQIIKHIMKRHSWSHHWAKICRRKTLGIALQSVVGIGAIVWFLVDSFA